MRRALVAAGVLLAAWLSPRAGAAQQRVPEGGEVLLDPPEGAEAWSWDLDGDGAFDDCGRGDCWFSAEDLDGPSVALVALWVDDVVRDVPVLVENVPPTVVSEPPAEARRGSPYRYAPVVADPAGALDPYTIELLEDESPPAMAVVEGEDEGTPTLVWTPDAADVAESPVRVHITVADGDGGTASQEWEVAVRDNAAPSGLTPFYPTLGQCVRVAQPTLKVGNASDPDGDPLVYFFEVDWDPGFRSIGLQQSPDEGLPEGDGGFTDWRLPSPLTAGSLFWRAWASDGAEVSESVVEAFVGCGGGNIHSADNDTRPRPELLPPLPALPDGPSEAGERVEGGCCGPSSDTADAGFGAAGLFALLVPSRRRTHARRPGSKRT